MIQKTPSRRKFRLNKILLPHRSFINKNSLGKMYLYTTPVNEIFYIPVTREKVCPEVSTH